MLLKLLQSTQVLSVLICPGSISKQLYKFCSNHELFSTDHDHQNIAIRLFKTVIVVIIVCILNYLLVRVTIAKHCLNCVTSMRIDKMLLAQNIFDIWIDNIIWISVLLRWIPVLFVVKQVPILPQTKLEYYLYLIWDLRVYRAIWLVREFLNPVL